MDSIQHAAVIYFALDLFLGLNCNGAEIAPNLATHCSETEFSCLNRKCIPLAKHCDGSDDCLDGSDERPDCDFIKCQPPNYFRCADKRCLSSAFVCDGENDCGDFSDERDCNNTKIEASPCEKGQWRCADLLCVPNEWVCNGERDCLDGSDETLGCTQNMTCDQFRCKNGHCVFKQWRCDGQDDCHDNSDEVDCPQVAQPQSCNSSAPSFPCANNKTCIPLDQLCDGTPNCLDRSDEGPFCRNTTKSCNVTHLCSHRCVQLSTGPTCLCPKGFQLTPNRTSCEDIDECKTYGICDQICVNTAGSYQCQCEEEYEMESNNRSCKSLGGEPILLFSSKTEVRAFMLRSKVYIPVQRNLKQVVGVDYDGFHAYWTEIYSNHETIVRSLIDGSNIEIIVTSGLGAPEDLKLDHLTGNIYFTDAERRHIGVCSNNGSACVVLVKEDINKPRGIVLYPERGHMYWSDWGAHPKIASSQMDGSLHGAFISTDIHWPNGLTVDYPNNRLYWTDARLLTLESINLDGTDRRIILKGIVKHPYGVAVFEDRLYWSDWTTQSIQYCNKFTGKDHHTLLTEKRASIYGMVVYHETLKKDSAHNPCLSSLCSDLCLLKSAHEYRCACPENKILSLDGHTCKFVGVKSRLILAADNKLMEIEHQALGRHAARGIPSLINKISAIAYNGRENVLYLSDKENHKIVRLDLVSYDVEDLKISNLGRIVAMDYDYLGNNLYYCDADRTRVEMVNLNTMAKRIVLHSETDSEYPESIALVPEHGIMFVSLRQQRRRRSHIDRVRMDGTSRRHHIELDLTGPADLMYDRDLNRIFFTDAGSGDIESTNLEGDDRHGFRSLLPYPVAIASLRNDLFWINRYSRRLFWGDKLNADNGYTKKISLDDLPKSAEELHIISAYLNATPSTPCHSSNGHCSHICFYQNNKTSCSCPIGMSLSWDNRTCDIELECTQTEFFCFLSNMCVPATFRCDGIAKCPHQEDEIDCVSEHDCPSDGFRCDSGECVGQVARCNAKFECKDKSDENNCTFANNNDNKVVEECSEGHFRCNDGKCIEQIFVCNTAADCTNGDDEWNCFFKTCTKYQFRCQSGSCIPKSWECDGEVDCMDFSDEHIFCGNCSDTMFTCANKKCISKKLLCNNFNDCDDNSDEIACHIPPKDLCPHGHFQCPSNSAICLPQSALCNHTSECPHHEDEQNCSDCHVDQFTCKNKKCISIHWICDENDDCGDNSDEEETLCARGLPKTDKNVVKVCNDSSHFQCARGGNCIDLSLVCNGQDDCEDKSDEGGNCNSACTNVNNPCAQICHRTPGVPRCDCKPGYRILGDKKNCEDIDECADNSAACSQICQNRLGSYTCDCYRGFNLRNDMATCKAVGSPMTLVAFRDKFIEELSPHSGNLLHLIHEEEFSIINGLDLDVKKNYIYFTTEDSGTLHKLDVSKNNTHDYIDHIGQPGKISVDWITGNVYIVNNGYSSKSISVCNFNKNPACNKLFAIDIHQDISAIAVDPVNKVLFYSIITWWKYNFPRYQIYRISLDGSVLTRRRLVSSSVGLISGLTFDGSKKELYYSDQKGGFLNKVTYQGTDNFVFQSNLTGLTNPKFFENHLYFIADDSMHRCQLFDAMACDSYALERDLSGFVIKQESIQPESSNLCENVNCGGICVAGEEGVKCFCEAGQPADPEECYGNEESLSTESVLGPKGGEQQQQPDQTGYYVTVYLILPLLVLFGFLGGLWYFAKLKRNSGQYSVGLRFANPIFGSEGAVDEESEEAVILNPGEHEFQNPMNFFRANLKQATAGPSGSS